MTDATKRPLNGFEVFWANKVLADLRTYKKVFGPNEHVICIKANDAGPRFRAIMVDGDLKIECTEGYVYANTN